MQQTDQTKKQQKRIPQITTRLEQIDKVLNKLYEDNALGTIPQDRYEQMSKKYSEEYYALKAELATLQEQLSAYENAGGRAQKFLKLTERHAAFTELTPAILNEFISRIEVHERDQKRARYAIQHISIYFNYVLIGLIRFSRFVRFSPSLTNWEIFFDLNKPNFDFFKKIFLTAFQGQKKPLSHHEDVIAAEIEKAR